MDKRDPLYVDEEAELAAEAASPRASTRRLRPIECSEYVGLTTPPQTPYRRLSGRYRSYSDTQAGARAPNEDEHVYVHGMPNGRCHSDSRTQRPATLVRARRSRARPPYWAYQRR